jgi:thiamine-monophosphate kinase
MIAVTTDSLSEEIRTGLYRDPYLAGWMLVMANLSDLAAVGAVPIGLLVSEILPPEFGDDAITELQQGIRNACDATGTFILGGDTNSGELLTLTGTAIGAITSDGPNSRKGCRPGDALFVSGHLGTGNAFALDVLTGRRMEGKTNTQHVGYRPVARLKEGAAICGLASSCMDTSDGAIATMDELMRLNNVGIEVDDGWMESLDGSALDLVRTKGIAPWLLLAGEHGEFELMFTIPPDRLPGLERIASDLDWQPVQIGRIIERQELMIPLYGNAVSLDHAAIRNASSGMNGGTRKYIKTLTGFDEKIRKETNS